MADIELHWADYLILAVFLVISLGIGIYHSMTGGKQKTVEEFIMANRALAVIPTAISLLVSYQSGISIVGTPAEIYSYGFQYIISINVAYPITFCIVSLVIVPWIYPLQLSSVHEYFYLRFKSKLLTSLAACLSLANAVMYIGIAMYAPSAAFEAVSGSSVSVKMSVPLLAAVCIAYTSLGGMRAVIWTDVFQFFVLMGGLLAILIKGFVEVGGYGNAFRLLNQQDRMNYINLSPDPRVHQTVWEYVIGFNLSYICFYGLAQAAVQRYSATSSLKKARLSILLNIPACFCFTFLLGSLSVILIAYYIDIECDPLANKQISSPNQLLPFFVIHLFSSSYGFTGLFLAALYGGTLSTVSSMLSGAAANCWKDILKWKFDHLQEARKALITRLLVILFGAVGIGVAFLGKIVPGPLTQVATSLLGSIIGPYYGLFFLGGISQRVNLKGTFVGLLCGLGISTWLSVGSMLTENIHPPLHPFSTTGCLMDNLNISTFSFQQSTAGSEFYQESTTLAQETQLTGLQNFYAISYQWFIVVGMLTTVLVGLIASLIFSDKRTDENFDERLLIPWSKIFTFRDSPQSSNNEAVYDSLSKVKNSPIYLGSSKNLHENGQTKLDLGKNVGSDMACL